MSATLANALWTTMAIQIGLLALSGTVIWFVEKVLKEFIDVYHNQKVRGKIRKNPTHNEVETLEDELSLSSFVLEQNYKKTKKFKGWMLKNLIKRTRVFDLINSYIMELARTPEKLGGLKKSMIMTTLSHRVVGGNLRKIYGKLERTPQNFYRLGFAGVILSLALAGYAGVEGQKELMMIKLNDTYFFCAQFLIANMVIAWCCDFALESFELRSTILEVVQTLVGKRIQVEKTFRKNVIQRQKIEKDLKKVSTKKAAENKTETMDFLPPLPPEVR